MEIQNWEEQIAGMVGYIQHYVKRYPKPIRDREQCMLEAELVLWRRMAKYNPEQPFKPWARTLVQRAVKNFVFRENEGHQNEIQFSNIDLTSQGGDETADEILTEWLAEHTVSGQLITQGNEEEIILRMSVEDFLTMIETRFGESCRMLRAAMGILRGNNWGDLEKTLCESSEKEIKRIVQTNLRAVWERWERGQKL